MMAFIKDPQNTKRYYLWNVKHAFRISQNIMSILGVGLNFACFSQEVQVWGPCKQKKKKKKIAMHNRTLIPKFTLVYVSPRVWMCIIVHRYVYKR